MQNPNKTISSSESISFSESVRARIDAVVKQAAFDRCGWVDVSAGALMLVDRLKSLREEGTSLRPEVYIFSEDDRDDLVATLGFLHRFQIGHMDRAEAEREIAGVFALAIKKCAPLARDGWSIFIKWNAQNINYGVMRRVAGLASKRPKDVLRTAERLPVLLFYQAAEGIVAIRGPGAVAEIISFSAMPAIEVHTNEEARRYLVKAVASDTGSVGVREQTESIVDIILNEAIVSGHGFLVGVKTHDGGKQNERWEFHTPPSYESPIEDGNYFPKWPIPLQSKLQLFSEAMKSPINVGDSQKNLRAALDLGAQLQGWVDLIAKMICSDGMTLFDSMGQVLGFNIFVYPPTNAETAAQRYEWPRPRSGGARWRAFLNMCRLVDTGALVGAYYQSQDGFAEWYGPEPR